MDILPGTCVSTEVASLAIDGRTSLPPEAHDPLRFGVDHSKRATEALK